MLTAHLNTIEATLMAQSATATNAGHPNLRGSPGEWFVRDFLENHLPSTLEIGQGEIIDAQSQANPPKGQYRPQVDVVIYRRDLPRIRYSQTDTAYLAEGVMATVECKTTLTETELESWGKTTVAHKSLTRNQPVFKVGLPPPYIVSYLVAYDGPAKMATVAGWIPGICNSLGTDADHLFDLIVVLGKGILWRIDAVPFLQLRQQKQASGKHWAWVDQPDGNLWFLFAHMLTWFATTSSAPDTSSYVENRHYPHIQLL